MDKHYTTTNDGEVIDHQAGIKFNNILFFIDYLNNQATQTPGQDFLPCPICKGVEGCDHTVIERSRAFRPMAGGTPDSYPKRLLSESDASLAERVDSWHQRHPEHWTSWNEKTPEPDSHDAAALIGVRLPQWFGKNGVHLRYNKHYRFSATLKFDEIEGLNVEAFRLGEISPESAAIEEAKAKELASPSLTNIGRGLEPRVEWPHEITIGSIQSLILDHQRDGQKQLKSRLNSSGSYLIRVAESFRWCLENMAARDRHIALLTEPRSHYDRILELTHDPEIRIPLEYHELTEVGLKMSPYTARIADGKKIRLSDLIAKHMPVGSLEQISDLSSVAYAKYTDTVPQEPTTAYEQQEPHIREVVTELNQTLEDFKGRIRQNGGLHFMAMTIDAKRAPRWSKLKSKIPFLEQLETDLVIECERAIKQQNAWLKSGVSTAQSGGSHDTAFGFILHKYLGELLNRYLLMVGLSAPQTEEEAYALATHRHYKGGLYRKIGALRLSEDANTPHTLYQHLWPHEIGYWGRPTLMFDEDLEDGTKRFTPLSN